MKQTIVKMSVLMSRWDLDSRSHTVEMLSPVSGETEFSTEVTASYKKATGGSRSLSRETSSSITVPAGKKCILTTTRERSKYEREDKFIANVEYGIAIWSDGDYRFYWDSTSQLKRVLIGEGTDREALGMQYRKSPLNKDDANWRCHPATLSYKHIVSFDKAVSGELMVTEEELS